VKKESVRFYQTQATSRKKTMRRRQDALKVNISCFLMNHENIELSPFEVGQVPRRWAPNVETYGRFVLVSADLALFLGP
jgi:hypothetical protein